ncbi:alpha/beta hydrolase [Frondihabitans cladoniiphilus]|uniref:DUF1023 domain-containing protein n=1 Tax=Frondihabitans cladoniiphilus TaxID=715785 RepID=A0ABP8VSA4_9MICO
MLFFAAAFLYSVFHLFGVTGPSVAPAHTVHESRSVSLSSVLLVDGVPLRHASAGDATSIVILDAPVEGDPVTPSLTACAATPGHPLVAASATTAVDGPRASIADPTACLAALAAAPSRQVRRFAATFDVSTGADVSFATVLGENTSAPIVSAWWARLPLERRTVLTGALPGVVGNLEGLPYSARDLANRVTLTTTIAQVQSDLDSDERAGARSSGRKANAGDDTRRLTMLQQISEALRPGSEGDTSPRSLLSLDTVFPGRAAVAVGDVDTAQSVSYMIPGMLYTVSNQIGFWTDRAAALHAEQTFWANDLATPTSPALTTATVAWMGYRTPDLTNVLDLRLAQAGATHLEDAVEGLDAVRASSPPRLNLIAHSYGSTTATIALSSGTIHADSLTVLGSPGSVVPKASDLAVTTGDVYAAAAPLDPVAGSAFFGADPGASGFGATLLSVAGGTDPYTHEHLTGTISHNGYFVPGSQSMRNLALIGIGHASVAGGRLPGPDAPVEVAGPNLSYVRPQDVNRGALV